MKTIKKIVELRNDINGFKLEGKSIGFVPTMGYLHDGHLRLVEQCRKENDVTVVSIFVNPTQFSPNEDFNSYPRDLQRDERLLKNLEVDIVFYPDPQEVYPSGYSTFVEVEKLSTALCGKSRPTHFRGVTTIVLKLLNMVLPNRAYFGRKDAQQAIIIKKMVDDLNLDIKIQTIPIVRDLDGLALSSRNSYLTTEERSAALCLNRSLQKAKTEIERGIYKVSEIKDILYKEIKRVPLVKIDYLELVSLDRLEQIEVIDPQNTLIAGAIWVGKTRLIDNFILGDI